MYMFGRSVRLATGNTRASAQWVAEVTEKVHQITDLNVTVWRNVFSPEINRVTWSTFVEDLSQLEAADDKLQADDGFATLLDSGATYVEGAADDSLGSLIAGALDPDRTIEYASAVRVLVAAGKMARGVELGIEIAQRVEKITGQPTLLIGNETTDVQGLSFATVYENIQTLQAAGQKLQQDTGFAQFIDKEVAGVYEGGLGAASQLIVRKVL